MESAALARAVGAATGSEVVRSRPVGGGDVASSHRMELADGQTVFAKTHPGTTGRFFSTEAAGLEWLAAAGAPHVRIPRVLAVSDGDGATGVPNHLVLEWIDEGRGGPLTEAELGRGLAALHAAGAPCFGRRDRRRTGSRGLPNEPCVTWAEFYATQRLLPLARLAADAGALPDRSIRAMERLAGRLDERGGPTEPPARLHGDLWAGNRLVDTGGGNWLIDPAAHGGHREFDLAMMRLFGGFGAACFDAYDEVAPLADGWQQRVPLHQVAPLVVHAIKFGGGYVSAAADAVDASG
jgi:fructosamine-3-kinase